MAKTNFILNKLAKVLEQGMLNYKDLSNEILSIIKSKRNEIIFKMKIVSKEEFDILKKRVEKLEAKIEKKKKIRKRLER